MFADSNGGFRLVRSSVSVCSGRPTVLLHSTTVVYHGPLGNHSGSLHIVNSVSYLLTEVGFTRFPALPAPRQ